MTDLIRFALIWLKLRLKGASSPDETFVQAVYRAYLKRDPDVDGKSYYLTSLQRKTMSRREVIGSIRGSIEGRQLRGLSIHPLDAQHFSRMTLVREHLPPAKNILDLGGATTAGSEGALLVMGYPHKPDKITIVDLPPEQRLDGHVGSESSQSVMTKDGIQVEYLYRSMSDLASIADASMDLVWSGQSIEHISEAEADVVSQQAFRILKPGGDFCLDTPNGALTRIQSPDKLIHPEHQKEYRVSELTAKLVNAGFEIVETKGLCAMPESLRQGKFDIREVVRNRGVWPDAEEGYLFYVRARKPLSRG